MKRIIAYTFVMLLLFGCSKNEPNDAPTSITLKTDKTMVLADGNDKVTFSVVDQTGADLTSSAEIRVDGKAIQGNTFSTTKEGFHTAVATYKSVTSNEVTFQSNIAKQLVLTADKATILANGVDKTTFTVTDADGNDVTTKAKIKVNGILISGNTYVATQSGEYKAVAILGDQLSNEVIIQANKPEAITLAADKVVILNTGEDVVTFTVTKPDGTDITKESKIMVNDKEIEGNTFTTTEVGAYYVKATWSGNKSNSIVIRAKAPTQYGLAIILSKLTFVCDNIDMVTFTCLNTLDNNNDLTDETTFYVDGKAIEGNFLQASVPGEFIITAKYETYEAPAVKVTAQKEFLATPKVFAEDFTGTWCPYCPRCIFMLNDAVKTGKAVGLGMHLDGKYSKDPFSTKAGYELYSFLNVDGMPTIVIDRDKTKQISGGTASTITNYQKQEVGVGIAMSAKIEGNNIVATARFMSNKSYPDANCVVILAENKLIADQANGVYPDLGNPIKDMEHNHVYRMSHNGKLFGEPFPITAGQDVTKTFTFAPKSEYKKENCEVIVLITNKDHTVINAQRVEVGKKTGY